MSSVAFFPGYPLLVAMLCKATGMPLAWGALAVSHAFLLASFVLLFVYLLRRGNGAFQTGTSSASRLPLYTLLAFGLFPPTFFLRMAYSESLFVFLSVLAMYGIERDSAALAGGSGCRRDHRGPIDRRWPAPSAGGSMPGSEGPHGTPARRVLPRASVAYRGRCRHVSFGSPSKRCC